MKDDHDAVTHIQQTKEDAEDLAKQFDGYEKFAAAVDALAQEQIHQGNEVQLSSDAAQAAMTEEENDRAAAIAECNVRHEVGQALFHLLEAYGYQRRFSAGEDASARQ